MSNKPQETLKSKFERSYLFGSVWYHPRFYFPYTDTYRPKYMLVIIPQNENGSTFIVLPTTNIQRYSAAQYADDVLIIPVGTAPFFTKETAISLNIHLKNYIEIQNNYVHGDYGDKIEYCGQFHYGLLNELHKKIMDSDNIAPLLKKQVPVPQKDKRF